MEGLTYEQALVYRHLRDGVLLDANLLLLYQIGRFSETAIGNFPHTKQYTVDDYRLLAKVVSLFRSVVTTPNILTEVSNLSGKLNESSLRAFRAGFGGTIDVLEEQHCASKTRRSQSCILEVWAYRRGHCVFEYEQVPRANR
jgi:hypothetical protein